MKNILFILLFICSSLLCGAEVIIGLTGNFRHGQVFLTWNKASTSSPIYKVYRSLSPITDGSQLSACEYLGKTDDRSAKDINLSDHDGTDRYLHIDSGAAPLSSSACLFVATTLETGDYFYAVTVLINNTEDITIAPSVNTLSVPLSEVVMTPAPVFQEQRTTDNKNYDIYTTFFSTRLSEHQAVLSGAGFFSADFAIFRNTAAGLHPLRIKFHGGGVDFISGITAAIQDEIILSCEDQFPGGETSAWWGTNENFDIYNAVNNLTPPVSGINYSYTLDRLNSTINWVIAHFSVDTNRIYMEGVSFGAPGAYFYTITYPDKIAASKISVGVYNFSFQNDYQLNCSLNPGKKNRKSGDSRFGKVSTNLLSNAGYHTYDLLNGAWMIHQFNSKPYPVIYCINGKRDDLMGWTEKPMYYDSVNANHIGGYYFWDNRNHGGTGKTWENGNFDFFRYRKNLSFPAFSNCSLNEDYGTGNGATGPEYGTVNGSLDWKNEVKEDVANWEAKIFVRNLIKANGSYLVYPDSCIVDITPRRIQQMQLLPGSTVNWAVIHNYQMIQSGSVEYDGNYLVIPNVKIFRDTSTLLLNSGQSLSFFYRDADGDGFGNTAFPTQAFNAPPGFTSDQSDCDDGNAAIYPFAPEMCNNTDDNCDGIEDEALLPYFADADADGFGSPADSIFACHHPEGYVINKTDCNDSNASINIYATELCNGTDDNCNGTTDDALVVYFTDEDGDLSGSGSETIASCQVPAGYAVSGEDCNDQEAAIHPGAVDVCNEIDDNCNGITDENALTAYISVEGPATICAPGIVQISALSSGPAMQFQWISNNLPIEGATNSFYNCSSSGNYAISISNGICTDISENTVVTINTPPPAEITPAGNVYICKGNTFKLTANQEDAVTYQWFRNNIPVAGAVSSSYTVAKNSDGDYHAALTSSDGCIAGSNIVTLTSVKKPAANITLQGDPDICQTGAVTLQASGKPQYSYKWYKNDEKIAGEFNQVLVATIPGYYAVKITENNAGCNKTSSPAVITSSCKILPEDEQQIASFDAYPNPSDGHFFLEFYGATVNSAGNIDVMNLLGEKIYSENISFTSNIFKTEVYLSEAHNSGIYIVRVNLNGKDFSTLLSVIK